MDKDKAMSFVAHLLEVVRTSDGKKVPDNVTATEIASTSIAKTAGSSGYSFKIWLKGVQGIPNRTIFETRLGTDASKGILINEAIDICQILTIESHQEKAPW